MLIRGIIERMRHDGCGGRVELLIVIEGQHQTGTADCPAQRLTFRPARSRSADR
jgi:hypothetical protein